MLAQEAGPAAVVPEATALSTAFTYQGQLKVNGVPAQGTYAFTFTLWDTAQNGSQLGTGDVQNAVAVTNGMFTVTLNKSSQFGADAFTGAARWLEIQVCKPGAVQCIKTTLTPKSAAGAVTSAVRPCRSNRLVISHLSRKLLVMMQTLTWRRPPAVNIMRCLAEAIREEA